MAGDSGAAGRTARPASAADNPLGVRHRRSFIAAPPPRIEPSLDDEDEDIPVLTEEVSGGAAKSADEMEKALAGILAADMAYAIEQYLAAELPTLIETALLNAKEELRTGINETVALALRNFLARRQQLRLPLEDPPSFE
ncbi:MAG: hypothetical protein HY777_08635 [Betaproteobacteria bacterium]|nr:hypothetical protein [Betaproteobacteria bacterium]